MLDILSTVEPLSFSAARAGGIQMSCNGCRICMEACAFLERYGNPGSIKERYRTDPDRWTAASFECSLCGLCTSVCPLGLDPAAMFLDFRKEAVEKDQGDFSEHQRLINYEKRGTSRKYTLYSLPENCDTIFFPGCSLTGTRPDAALKSYQYLKAHIHGLGIVLDCCTKPSHDLGRQAYFNRMFSELKEYLLDNGIHRIIVACPSCYKIFNTYAPEFTVETVYDIMALKGFEDGPRVSGDVTIHDPCPVRFETRIQDSVRFLVKARGLDIVDMPHEKEKTFCCGEGGAVSCLSPEFARGWTKKRINEAHPHKIVSYCAGCVHLLSKRSTSIHILDLLFDPEKAIAGKARVSKAPVTYLNRLNLKMKLKKLPVKTMRERTCSAREGKNNTLVPKLLIAGLILAVIAVVRTFGIQDYLDQELLSRFIQESGKLAPVIYMLIYTVAPALFLPGLPITIVGGILFGPFWGVV